MAATLSLCLLLNVAVTAISGYTLLDLTYDFDGTSLYWPNGQKEFELTILAKGLTPAGFWYQGDEFAGGTHGGTHMDAPIHFFEGGLSVDEIPISKLTGPAVVVDIRQATSTDPDTNLTLSDLQAWESNYGRIPQGAIVLQCSGWSSRYPNKTLVFGNDRGDTTDFHFPAFHADAVKWLIDERQIVGIGVDTPSTDYGQSKTYPTHIVSSSKNIYGLENVKDPCAVPPSGATLRSFPTKISDASGAPVRVIAEWDTSPVSGSPWFVSNVGAMIPSLLVVTTLLSHV